MGERKIETEKGLGVREQGRQREKIKRETWEKEAETQRERKK